jgi:hypothetical protein
MQTGDIDLRATMKPIGVYPRDPTTRWMSNSFAKAVLTPEGPGTMSLTWDRAGTTTAEAWGSGADWLVDRAPHWVGLHDDVDGFDATLHPTIAEWTRRCDLAGTAPRVARPTRDHRGSGQELGSHRVRVG